MAGKMSTSHILLEIRESDNHTTMLHFSMEISILGIRVIEGFAIGPPSRTATHLKFNFLCTQCFKRLLLHVALYPRPSHPHANIII